MEIEDTNVAEEVSLVDFFHLFWEAKKIIISISFISACISIFIALTSDIIYESETTIQYTKPDTRSLDSPSSLILGSIGMGNKEEIPQGRFDLKQSVVFLTSREVIYPFLKEQKVTQHLYPLAWDENKQEWLDPDNILLTDWKVYEKYLRDHLIVQLDQQTKLVNISVRDNDPEKAANFALELVNTANREAKKGYLSRVNAQIEIYLEALENSDGNTELKSITTMLERAYANKLWAETHDGFLFEILDLPVAPKERIAPARTRMTILGTSIGFIISLIIVIGIELWRERDA